MNKAMPRWPQAGAAPPTNTVAVVTLITVRRNHIRCRKLLEQRFYLLQINRAESLCGPAVDVCQHAPGLVFLPLLLPQSVQAHRCAVRRIRTCVSSNWMHINAAACGGEGRGHNVPAASCRPWSRNTGTSSRGSISNKLRL